MESLQAHGIEIILALQSVRSPALDAIFTAITQLGGAGYLLLLPLVVWCFDRRLGLRAAMAMMAGQLLVALLKDVFQEPRPFLVDARIASKGEVGLSFPSGHALGAMVYYGIFAAQVKRTTFTVAMASTIFLVGFSRSYLGVHYPHDVVAGWILGALVLASWLRAEGPVAAAVRRRAPPERVAITLGIPLVLAILHQLVWPNPAAFGIAGAVSGAGLALLTLDPAAPKVPQAGPFRRVARLLVGMPIVLLAVRVTARLYPEQPGVSGDAVVWCSGVLTMLLVGIALPWLFRQIRLGEPA